MNNEELESENRELRSRLAQRDKALEAVSELAEKWAKGNGDEFRLGSELLAVIAPAGATRA
jgi:F0F1-type ATP synthase assembly protein I